MIFDDNSFFISDRNIAENHRVKSFLIGFVLLTLGINFSIFCLYQMILWLPFSLLALIFVCFFQKNNFRATRQSILVLAGGTVLMVCYTGYVVWGLYNRHHWSDFYMTIMVFSFILSCGSVVYVLENPKADSFEVAAFHKCIFLLFILTAGLFFSFVTEWVDGNPYFIDFYFVFFLLAAAVFVLVRGKYTDWKSVLVANKIQASFVAINHGQNQDVNSDFEMIKSNLNSFFKNRTAYTNPSFSLEDLAQQLNTSTREVSTYLNKEHKMNFYQLVGQYRVHYAVKCMEERPNYTLEAIMEESGFGSYSSFVSHFKQVKGVAPSNYRKLLLQ